MQHELRIIHSDIHIHIHSDPSTASPALINLLTKIQGDLKTIMADQQLEIDALNKIDAATTQIAQAVTDQAGVVQTIATEVTALVAAQQAAGVPQAIIDQTTALGDRLQQAATALVAQTPALQAIASQGASNPVPVTPPTP